MDKVKLGQKKIKEIIGFILTSGYLKTLKRTGWVIKGIRNPESVADHSWRVALMALILADDFNFNKERLVSMALIHDLGEVGAGDVRLEAGDQTIASKEIKEHKEKKFMKQMIKKLGRSDDLLSLWQEWSEKRTKEAKFVQQLDKLEMAFQALEYQKMGYSAEILDEFWRNAEKHLRGKELEPILLELKRMRKQSE